ncbi:phage virion morphogenesis protein [Deinococcus ruber]|uniref:Phage virion morphogenesis protein n=1 Tax=Deinococcus ruber TaxID=1848197 RepID=A0A918C286_9DEIO|nr:phage virion morphogenesis protein [Deinococcus ruber]GGR00275.1 hypothetical protein GCM10008957_11290 [Deinococcus ruber]
MSSLRQLRRQLAALTDPRTLHDLHNLAGRDIAGLVQAGFVGEHDPNGDPWLRSKAAKREGRKTLRDTGALQDGIRWKADSRAVVIFTTGKANRYAAVHQYGSRGRAQPRRSNGRFRSRKSTAKLKRSVSLTYLSGLPKRQFLPEGEIPLPYERKLSDTFRAYFKERFG